MRPPTVFLLTLFATLVTAGCGGGAADAGGPSVGTAVSPPEPVSADWLATLPDGETKRWFVNQCAGCHLLDGRIFRVDGAPRSRESWATQTRAMMEFAGAETDFPILRPSLDSESLASWLTSHAPEAPPAPGSSGDDDGAPDLDALPFSEAYEVRVYPMPDPEEVPHDVAVDSAGRVIVTGMGSHAMYVLDPGAEAFREIPIPVEYANPRAVEIDADGDWWVVLGYPEKLARYRPDRDEWATWELGAYPHEIALDDRGRVWFNGHFTVDPEILGYLDVETGKVETFEVPYGPMPDGGSTIPYGLRVGPDGRVWMTQLFGGRLVGFDPSTEAFEAVEFSAGAAPRRHDVDREGRIWVPEFGANRLAAHDPATGALEEHPFPIPDALPYAARADGEGGVWVGTAAAGAIGRFDVAAATWEMIRLPLEAPLVRHLAIDPRSGAVWGSASPFPARGPAVFRVTRKDPVDR